MRVDKNENYSHSGGMVMINLSTDLRAPADAVWGAVKTPAAFLAVTRGVISMPVLRGRHHPWREGETIVGWVFLFGFLPFSRHRLHVFRIDETTRTLVSRESGGLLRRWDHDIIVTPIDDDTCEYRDRIDIDAGLLTPLVLLYARWFYGVRQRRWRELAMRMPR